MKNQKYIKLWIVFVNIKAKDGRNFYDLIDSGDSKQTEQYIGAWANLIIKADTIGEALDIVPGGLSE